ncbi:PREDICTED: replication factor A protein 1-like [Ipomoea nil]|uniref:replication factor A protein 1-like n=1 Tax=Ipomoea nil TaxID=35883 RepID=UPI0009019932|nr:PREDICTED: replication factor A protein 1-like [Ipomoea nil]
MPSLFIAVKDIQPIHKLRGVRVRCVRVYVVPESRGGGNTIKSMECFLHDDQGDYVHVNIQNTDVRKYKEVIKEGQLYEIKKKIYAVTNYYMYKITQHKYMLKFNYKTEVKLINSKGFPLHMFRLTSFVSLKDPNEVNEKELIDVMDRVVEIYNPVDKIVGGRAAKLIDFQICDNADNYLMCTLWDSHVDSLLPYYNSDSKEPVIVAIQCCRANVVNGEVRITSSYDATKLWFNEEFDEFKDFRSNFGTGTLHSQSTGIERFQKGETIDGQYFVPAEIIAIEASRGEWYYMACMRPGCNKKLKESEGSLVCDKCEKHYQEGTARYKILVRVLDKTKDAPFLLWDREVADLVGIPTALLYQKYKQI